MNATAGDGLGQTINFRGRLRPILRSFLTGLHADTLRLLDQFETPWRGRQETVAIQIEDGGSIPCWAYFPEWELKPTRLPALTRGR